MTFTTFTNGTVADADEVNANFDYLKNTNRFLNSPIYPIFNLGTSNNVVPVMNKIYVNSSYIWIGDKYTTTSTFFTDSWTEDIVNGISAYNVRVNLYSTGKLTAYRWSGTSVEKTTNGGSSWSSCGTLTNCSAIMDINANGDTVLVGGYDSTNGNGIWYSTDGGSSFSQTTTSIYASSVGISEDGNTFFAIDTTRNIYKSTDGGSTFTDTSVNVDIEDTNGICYTYSVDENTLFYVGNNDTSPYTSAIDLIYLSGSNKLARITYQYDYSTSTNITKIGNSIFTLSKVNNSCSLIKYDTQNNYFIKYPIKINLEGYYTTGIGTDDTYLYIITDNGYSVGYSIERIHKDFFNDLL